MVKTKYTTAEADVTRTLVNILRDLNSQGMLPTESGYADEYVSKQFDYI